MNTFPALAQTHVLERQGPEDFSRIPIIGWVHVQGAMAFPICAIAFGGMNRNRGIEHPDGMVSYPSKGLVFTDALEWLNFVNIAPEEPEEEPAAIFPSDADEPAENFSPPGPDGDDVVEVVGNTATVAASGPAIVFGTKMFTTNSFWHMPDQKAIFMIEGGSPYPKDKRCAKIKRDEYSALKREGWTVIDPTGEVVEDDDDMSDLV